MIGLSTMSLLDTARQTGNQLMISPLLVANFSRNF